MIINHFKVFVEILMELINLKLNNGKYGKYNSKIDLFIYINIKFIFLFYIYDLIISIYKINYFYILFV